VTSKITAILLIFTQGSEHSLTEIARLAGLPVSTAHRLATELVARGLLDRAQDGSYRAAPPLRLIGTVDRSRPRIAERAPWVLEDLCDATGSRVRLGVLRDSTVVSYIEKHPGPVPATSFTPAATVPAHPTALGRALVAFAPARTVEMTILLGLRPYTGHTVTSPDRFRRALAVTRLTGVAITREEFEAGISGVAMPVFGPDGSVVAAIEVTVTDLHRDLVPVITVLTIAARSLTREITANAPPATRQAATSLS
jgi:DNA-binding IclR family transcriptional regulator